MTNGDYWRNRAEQAGIAPRTLADVKASIEQARKSGSDGEFAALMLKHGRLTDDAREYVLLARIEALQAVQRTNPPSSAAWQNASKELAPLFAEMARRSKR